MNGKEFLDYLKKVPEEEAISIIDGMNKTADEMAEKIIKYESMLNDAQTIGQEVKSYRDEYEELFFVDDKSEMVGLAVNKKLIEVWEWMAKKSLPRTVEHFASKGEEEYNKAINDACAVLSNTSSWCVQNQNKDNLVELKLVYDILQKTKNDIVTLKRATNYNKG